MTAPEDWYPDPHVPNQLRWWDGESWTKHVMPDPAARSIKQPLTAGQLVKIIIGVAFAAFLLYAWASGQAQENDLHQFLQDKQQQRQCQHDPAYC